MNAILHSAAVLLSLAISASASAEQVEHPLGDHPAVIIKRRWQQEGYDYASKFYPHPAWLYLAAEAPRPMMEHPAVIVFRRYQSETQQRPASSEIGPSASNRRSNHECFISDNARGPAGECQ